MHGIWTPTRPRLFFEHKDSSHIFLNLSTTWRFLLDKADCCGKPLRYVIDLCIYTYTYIQLLSKRFCSMSYRQSEMYKLTTHLKDLPQQYTQYIHIYTAVVKKVVLCLNTDHVTCNISCFFLNVFKFVILCFLSLTLFNLPTFEALLYNISTKNLTFLQVTWPIFMYLYIFAHDNLFNNSCIYMYILYSTEDW